MGKDLLSPDYIFESSWEVCNKVGGIYTVLSTRAKTLQNAMCDRIIFIGPDCWKESQCPYFIEDDALMQDWREEAAAHDLYVRVGRWDIPGTPIAILVDFMPFFEKKDWIYTRLWELYQVDSLHAYGDYDEASMFSYAAALVVESFYQFYLSEGNKKVVYHGNEWMTGLGLLYIRYKLPQIATVFTTHATSIGRSIAGNNKPLYDYLFAYNGDQMAGELNMQSKHSIEKQTAKNVDCFTTVSDITANECKELLDKPVDFVLPNGFENNFVPKGALFTKKRKNARKRLIDVANALMGNDLTDDVIIVSTSGRYEFRNKGVDVYIEAMNRLLRDRDLQKTVLAFIEVPGWVGEPRKDLVERLESGKKFDTPLEVPLITHWLHNMSHDNVLGMLKFLNMWNRKEDKVKLVFLPCYLTGDDGVLNMSYYDLVLGNDITTPVAINEFNSAGFDSVFDTSKIVMVMDHFVPNKDIKSATQCKQCRMFAHRFGIEHYYDVGTMGIEHALLPEQGLVAPGEAIIGADSHTCTYGAVNAFSTGVGSTDLGAAMAVGYTWFKVPAAIKVNVTGKKKPYVSGKDLILYLLQVMHQELNYWTNNQAFNGYPDQYNRVNTFQAFVFSYDATNKSIISDLFYGTSENTTKCDVCNKIIYNCQKFEFLTFGVCKYNQKEFNLYNGFDDYIKVDQLTGDNQYYCNNCKKLCDAKIRTTILIPPNYLLINIDYGKNKKYMPSSINYDEEIDISKYVSLPNQGNKYKIIGICSHLGDSGMYGHYVAYCKNKKDNKWYQFNDSFISDANFEIIKTTGGTPYLLLYERIF